MLYEPADVEPDLVLVLGPPTRLPPSLVWELAYGELVFEPVALATLRPPSTSSPAIESSTAGGAASAGSDDDGRADARAYRDSAASCCGRTSSARPTASSCC